jgi:hypothetical protein
MSKQTTSDLELPVYDRRGSHGRPRGDWGAWLRPERILALATLIAGTLVLLGYRRVDLEPRVSLLESRVDRLERGLELLMYMQCVQLRRTDPAALPPGCEPVIQARGRP